MSFLDAPSGRSRVVYMPDVIRFLDFPCLNFEKGDREFFLSYTSKENFTTRRFTIFLDILYLIFLIIRININILETVCPRGTFFTYHLFYDAPFGRKAMICLISETEKRGLTDLFRLVYKALKQTEFRLSLLFFISCYFIIKFSC